MDRLQVSIEQFSPVLGNADENRRRIESAVDEVDGVDLMVFPELSLTGYDLKDRVSEFAGTIGTERPPLDLPPGGPVVVAGLIERGEDQLCYNSAIALKGSEMIGHHRKVYLPTYGMFDEGRYFARSRAGPAIFELVDGWKAGLLICEDLWHPALAYLLAQQRVDLIIVPAAAPGRDLEESDGVKRFGSMEPWELLARTTAFVYGVYLILANRSGAEGDLSFAGGSLLVGPDGKVLRRAPHGETHRIRAELSKEEVGRARREFSHLRDEDPELTFRALGQILEAG